MKKTLLASIVMFTQISSFAAVKYNCAVTNYLENDNENYVENIIVTLDSKSEKRVLPVSKKRVSISLSTFKTRLEDIKKYGQYSLSVRISDDKDIVSSDEIYISIGSTFVGLDDALQVTSLSRFGGKSEGSTVGVHCLKI